MRCLPTTPIFGGEEHRASVSSRECRISARGARRGRRPQQGIKDAPQRKVENGEKWSDGKRGGKGQTRRRHPAPTHRGAQCTRLQWHALHQYRCSVVGIAVRLVLGLLPVFEARLLPILFGDAHRVSHMLCRLEQLAPGSGRDAHRARRAPRTPVGQLTDSRPWVLLRASSRRSFRPRSSSSRSP